MRLNQFLARNTGLSRRQVDALISQKLVKVNNELAVLGHKLIETDTVQVFLQNRWQELLVNDQKAVKTILFYKPIFTMTTRYDPQKRRTVYDLLPKTYFELKSAGRLDYMSEGLLVLSSDGDLVHRLTHPKNLGEKKYLVALKKQFTSQTLEIMNQGEIKLKSEDRQLNPMQVRLLEEKELVEFSYLKFEPKLVWYEFILTEGRNNQIRRVCMEFDNPVFRLIRTAHSEFELTKELYTQKYLVV